MSGAQGWWVIFLLAAILLALLQLSGNVLGWKEKWEKKIKENEGDKK